MVSILGRIKNLIKKSGITLFFIRLPYRSIVYTLNRINTIYWSFFLGRAGKGLLIECGVHFENPKTVFLSDNVRISKGTFFISEKYDSKIEVGSNVHIGEKCHIDYTGNLEIHKNVLLSEQVSIFSHSHGYDPRSEPVPKKTIIKNNCWIGYRALILESVEVIERNIIIGAGSTVTKKCDIPYGIYVGSPAKYKKIIKYD